MKLRYATVYRNTIVDSVRINVEKESFGTHFGSDIGGAQKGTKIAVGDYKILSDKNEIKRCQYIRSGKYGIVDRENNVIIPFIYDAISPFYQGYARVNKDNKYGIIDKNGNIILDTIYEFLECMKDGYAAFTRNGKWGYVDKKGSVIVPPIYDDVFDFTGYSLEPYGFNDGYAAVKKDGKWGFVDKSGKVKVSLNYDKVSSFINGYARVLKGRNYGVIGKNGEVVIPFVYNWIIERGNKTYDCIQDSGNEVTIVIDENRNVWEFGKPDSDKNNEANITDSDISIKAIVDDMLSDLEELKGAFDFGNFSKLFGSRLHLNKKYPSNKGSEDVPIIEMRGKKHKYYDSFIGFYLYGLSGGSGGLSGTYPIHDNDGKWYIETGYFYLDTLKVTFVLNNNISQEKRTAIFNELSRALGSQAKMNASGIITGEDSFIPKSLENCSGYLFNLGVAYVNDNEWDTLEDSVDSKVVEKVLKGNNLPKSEAFPYNVNYYR